MELGEKIFKLRTKKHWSQGDVADALGVSRQSVSKWETNASVPELDKLIKLCKLFEISLDDLVAENAEDNCVAEPDPGGMNPKIFYIERPIRLNFSMAQIFGAILLFCAFLCLILLVCFDSQKDLFEVLMLCLPVAICGFFCMITHHPLLWCGWCGSAAWWIYTLFLAAKWESAVLLLVVGVLLVLLTLLYTVRLHRKRQITIPAWLWLLLISFLAAAAFLLIINLVPLDAWSVEYSTQIAPVTDASITTE